MIFDHSLAGLVTVGLMIYLFYALPPRLPTIMPCAIEKSRAEWVDLS